MSGSAHFDATLERHHPELPVFVMVPGEVALGFGKSATFVVEAMVDNQPIGRRSIKPWGDGRWFMELTKAHGRRLGIAAGSSIRGIERVVATLRSRE